MRDALIKSLKSFLQGNLEKHKTNIEVYLNQSVGIGEHSDIIDTIEKELDSMVSYEDKLQVLDKYFGSTESNTKELLKD
jgi:predicted AAA+ superfamily ATPase